MHIGLHPKVLGNAATKKPDLFFLTRSIFLKKVCEEHNGKNVLAIKRRVVVIRQTHLCGSACSEMNLPINIVLPLLAASFVFQVNKNLNNFLKFINAAQTIFL